MALETGAGFAMQGGSYAAIQTRRAIFGWAARTGANTPGLLSGGLYSATDMQLSAASSGLVVNISTGECLIPGTEATSQGGYYALNQSQSSVTLATANGSNPRVDLVCVTSADAQYTTPSGGTSGFVTIQAVTGTPTSGANLTNLSGAPTLPGSSLLLGYALVPATATSLTSGDIANRPSIVSLQATGSGARTWTTLSLLNSWVASTNPADTTSPAYTVWNGVVYLRGAMGNGSSGTEPFVMPAGARPAATAGFNPTPGNGGTNILLYIAPNGATNLFWATDSFMVLDSVRYPAEG